MCTFKAGRHKRNLKFYHYITWDKGFLLQPALLTCPVWHVPLACPRWHARLTCPGWYVPADMSDRSVLAVLCRTSCIDYPVLSVLDVCIISLKQAE